MFQLEEHYWWFVGRRYIVAQLLRHNARLPAQARILDIGCGSGGNIPTLQMFGNALGVDVSLQALNYCQQRRHCSLANARANQLPIKDGVIDLATMLDVLEHIEDDRNALREIWRTLKPSGQLLLTVPAYPSLWSEHDEALHHQRRYRFNELKEKVRGAGFRVVRMSYAIAAVIAPVYLFRWLQRLRPRKREPKTALIELPLLLNNLLVTYLKAEARLIPRTTLPFGVSIVCLAEKSGESIGL